MSRHIFIRGSLLAALIFLAAPLYGDVGDFKPSGETPLQITNVMQLRRLADSNQRLVGSLRLEGVVWWSSETEGRVILQDDSGVAQLELDLPCPMPHQGARLSLTGNCTAVAVRDAIKLSDLPVVENDGLHTATEQSGSIYLKAGLQPIRVLWFNRTAKYELEASYAGPGLPRQKMPDAALFRPRTDPLSGATNFVNGLDYRCCEGLWWSSLPNLSHLTAVKTGTANNFDLNVKSREEHVGLQFSGYLQINREGRYTFYTKSDDGSRLYVGDSSLQIKTLGWANLPAPQPAATALQTTEAGNYQWCTVEGTINSVNRLQDALEIDLVTEAGHMKLKVAENSDCSFILVPQNRIRTFGACRNIFRLDGARAPGEFFVQGWSDIEQRYVTPDLWSAYPLMTISNAVSASLPGDAPSVVHLRGRVISAGAGRPAYLEDASGRVALALAPLNRPDGQTSEALGRLQADGAKRVLRCVYFRELGEISNGTESLPVLTTAEQVHQLSQDELKRGYPVKLRGVVTAAMAGDAVILQDTTRAIWVYLGSQIPLQTGDYCEVEGAAAQGDFNPYIRATRVNTLGAGVLPNPVRPDWDQLLNGSLEDQYVEIEGVITGMEGDTITLLTRDGTIKVGMEAQSPALPNNCLNALVRIRGCLLVSWDQQTHRVNVGKLYLMQRWLSVVQPAPIDPFALAAKRVGDLLKFDPQAGALQRVKVFGQIIYQGDAGSFLMDGVNGLRFMYAGKPTAHVDDQVEVVGFPDFSGPAPVLRGAEVRRQGMVEKPKPRELTADDLVRDEYDSTLVRVEGVLLGLSSTSDGTVLEMQSGLRRFMAVVNDKAGLDSSLAPSSRLELTGVYVGQGGNRVLGQPIDSFRLLLNTGYDVRVLSRPPWWNLKRLLTVVAALVGILLTALIWIRQLHREVAQRARQLEAQIQQRQRAEHQREVEQERSRVARDLHDDLGAGLTRVNMLASLLSSPATSGEVRAQYLADLNGFARDMVTSLDEIVWAVNPRNDTVASLVGYFAAHSQQLLALASVKLGLDVAEELPDSPLDAKFRHQVFMAFKEVITNIIRHSGATKVWLRVRVENGVLSLEMADNGRGFDPNQRMAGADGLANMQARLTDLGGCCRIQSAPGKGTTIRLEAPLPKVSTFL